MSQFARTPELIGSMSSMVPGTQATMNIPRSHTYFSLGLHIAITGVTVTAANVATYVDKIVLRINGEPRYEIKGSQLEKYWADRNVSVADNFIPVLLSQPHMRTAAGEDVSGYGTTDVRTFEIHVELAAGAHVITKLDLYAVRGANTPLGAHYRLSTYRRSASGAGDFELNSFTRARQRIMAIYLSTDNVDDITLKADDVIIHSTKKEVREGFLNALSKRSQNGITMVDLNTSNRLEDMFEVLGRDVRMTCNMTAAANFDVLVESFEDMGIA